MSLFHRIQWNRTRVEIKCYTKTCTQKKLYIFWLMDVCICHKLHLTISQHCRIFNRIFIIFPQFWRWQFMLCKNYLSTLWSALTCRFHSERQNRGTRLYPPGGSCGGHVGPLTPGEKWNWKTEVRKLTWPRCSWHVLENSIGPAAARCADHDSGLPGATQLFFFSVHGFPVLRQFLPISSKLQKSSLLSNKDPLTNPFMLKRKTHGKLRS